MTRLWIAVLALAACARGNETCSQLTPCPAGGYQFCKSGAVCAYHLTDGTQVNCARCSDCVKAIELVQKWCDPSTNPFDLAQSGGADLAEERPDLAGPALMIPKSGSYSGPKSDPMLYDAMMCPDYYLEPNELASPLVFDPRPDMPTAKIVKMAICPSGARDSDWFQIDLRQYSTMLWMTAQLFYDVQFGDLDVAIVDASGEIVVADGSAVTNGCTASALTPAVYYVVVAGANNLDANRYEILIKTYGTAHVCP